MWLIQTPIEGLVLPTDTDGRLSLGGHVPTWQHIVRGREASADGAEARLSACDLEWEMRPWYEAGSKIYFHGCTGAHDELLERVRVKRERPLTKATFPEPGRRRVDRTVQLTIIVPPTIFAQFESMVRLAMQLPAGTVVLTVPIPLYNSESSTDSGADEDADSDASASIATHHLLSPGQSAFVSGCELVVSRAPAVAFSAAQLVRDKRTPVRPPALGGHLDDDGYADWFHFRRVDDDRGRD